MKHIKTDSIYSRSASSENANFPISRTADMHPKRKYKALAGAWFATITIEVVGGCSDIMLAGTNATSLTITASDPNQISWGDSDTWGDGDTWANTGASTTIDLIQNNRSQTLWAEFGTPVLVPCVVSIVAYCPPTDTLEIGVLRAGLARTYGASPKYGLSEGRVDYSIVDENSNGSFSVLQRDKVRTFVGELITTRAYAWELADNYDEMGMEPTAWRLTDHENSEYAVFARFTSPPQSQHLYPGYSAVNFELLEVI